VQVGTLSECSFPAVVFTLAFMLLLFPTGTLPSRRWRPVAAVGLLLAALTTAGQVIHPRLVHLPAPGGVSLIFPNPLAVPGLGPVLRTVLVGTINGLTAVSVPFLVAALVSLGVRYRAGGRLLRQQITWLTLTAVGFVAGLLIALLGLADGQAWLATVAYTSVQIISLLGIPAAMAIAILRERLYDIDVIISRAVVHGLLSAAFTGVYVGIVLGIGTFVGHQGGPVLTIAAAVTIALLFQPLRRRAQQFANRLVYSRRATPYQALSDFAGDMAGQLDLTEAVDRMVTVLAGATGADRAEAWIRVGAELRPAAIWPHGAAPSAAIALGPDGGLPAFEGASRAAAVQHGGEQLGALSLQKPRNESLTSTEDELLQHLASQAGLVLRNAALIDELRASRRRLVEAQDAERRKIERNLHDRRLETVPRRLQQPLPVFRVSRQRGHKYVRSLPVTRPLHATFWSARAAFLARQADGPDSGKPSVPRYTGMSSTCTPAAWASTSRSPGSEVRMSSPSSARHTTAASIASARPLRASSIPARRPRPSSSAAMSTPASSRATGTCRPVPPRHTWATTPPWLTGTRSARRSRLISAATSRSPRSTATNAPASSTSTSGRPALSRSALVVRSRLAPHDHRAPACAASGLAHLCLGDLAVLGLERGHELIQRTQPPVMRRLQAQRIIHPRADALRPPRGHRLLGHRHQVRVHRRRQPLLGAHTNMLQPC